MWGHKLVFYQLTNESGLLLSGDCIVGGWVVWGGGLCVNPVLWVIFEGLLGYIIRVTCIPRYSVGGSVGGWVDISLSLRFFKLR